MNPEVLKTRRESENKVRAFRIKRGIEHERENPERRAKKATGLSGRQWVKHRKAQRRKKA